MFRAAVEVGFAQRAFAVLARMRTTGVISQPARLAHVLDRAARALDFMDSARGRMVVRVEGVHDTGRACQRRAWHLTADNDKGPKRSHASWRDVEFGLQAHAPMR